PFMPVLFNGWGFGIDYNEPRGHHYMLIDQSEIDPARVKAGGACLTCKSPYAEELHAEDADTLFASSYVDARNMIPEQHRELGATCIDCHDNETMEISTRRWTVDSALSELGLEPDELTKHQQGLMVCGQCHCTYSVMKDGDTVLDVDFPWEGSEWGAITVENIIVSLETDPKRLEWKQAVTGMKLGFIRHPDVEFFTAGSVHMKQGLTCAECHMPDITVNNKTISDHNIMSPLKRDGMACQRCHYDTPEEIRAKVVAIQDANLAQLLKAGYKTATVAKLLQLANSSLDPAAADVKPTYDEAAGHYRQALYRVIFMGAENSVGFHNPAEGQRILADAAEEADQADALLRELLASKGVAVPAEVPLQLRTYLDNRGTLGKSFIREQYVPDPTGSAEQTWPASLGTLLQ
ncbi:ammonia-forming cytochrome c nitrite reductase subunit c552, partial [bacterium]|nr:ammonia-forming cytochrome c nitrite reductase subunit c552 [bacterium]